MKNITDYFISPSKTGKPAEQADSVVKYAQSFPDPDQNVNMENKFDSGNVKISNNELNKRIKKKRRRKPTDPEVKDVTELLSNNLSLISPNTSGTKNVKSPSPLKQTKRSKLLKNTPKNVAQRETGEKNLNSKSCKSSQTKNELSSKESCVTINDNAEIYPGDTECKDTESNLAILKVNAFQFLMNSRNNIIGQNSNGKIANEQDTSIGDQKSKLTSRKDLFKNWANQKGALKRKREEVEIERCISQKLEKRAKRLTNLLQGKLVDSDNVKKRKSLIKAKKAVKINSSSDSENSIDITKEVDPSSVDLNETVEENAQDVIVTTASSPFKKHKDNGQHNLLNFFGVLNQEIEERIEVFDDSSKDLSKELIKIKMFTPESTKKRTSLLSLNRDVIKSMTDESSQESVRVKKHKKKKKKHHQTTEKSHCDGQLNDSMEDFCSPEGKKVNTSITKLRKDKLKKNGSGKDAEKHDEVKRGSISKDSGDESEIIAKKCVEREGEGNVPQGKSCKKSTTENAEVIIDESTQDSNKIKSKKTGSKLLVDNDSVELVYESVDESKTMSNRRKKHNIIDDDSEALQQDSIATTSRTRKKLKKVTDINGKEIGASSEIKPEHTEPQGRVLRPKRSNVNYSDRFREENPKSPMTNRKEKISKKTSNKDESLEKVELSSESDYEETVKKKSVKVAPVFLKATPKPKLDPDIAEARKKFLMSGVPDSLKKTVDKQRSIEEKEYDIFPSISHIQQKCQSRFWNLPEPNIRYALLTSFYLNEQSLIFQGLVERNMPYQVNISAEIEKICNLKSVLDKIKSENPNYPVYKVFRQIYDKSGKNFLKVETEAKKSARKRPKKASRKSSEPVEPPKPDCEMWSEKYKPRSSDEILGNHGGVSSLKNWLETWMNYSVEINARGKRKRADSSIETDFESTDCDSRDSTRFPGNTVVLGGPCGSGKTSAVYAIANELGFNVLELNASSKRTGKRLMQEMQEATQSHQVRKNKNNCMTKFELKAQKDNIDEESSQKDKKKMCILLVEDIDLVFDQDEGFLASLSQLIMTSKRPVILTTTDNSPAHVQKLVIQHEYISFMPLSLQCLGVWLQILCLVEGLLVDKDDLGNLLEHNKGDIRKTLLEVQFWSQSGGQLERSRMLPLISQRNSNKYSKHTDEDLQINLTDSDLNENEFVHKQCVGSFEVFRENKEFSVPKQLNLGLLWWNMHNILNVASCAEERLHRQQRKQHEIPELENVDSDENDINKLKSALRLYNALTLTDSLFKTVNYQDSNEPVVKNWLTDIRDSSELTERIEDQGIYLDMVHDLTHTLVNGCVENYKSIEKMSCGLNMALPDSCERRWRAKQHMCEDFLKEPISLSNILDRSSIALDYLPTLRDIARYEDRRAASNTKRGNRFRHYLKNLNMSFKDSSCKLACLCFKYN